MEFEILILGSDINAYYMARCAYDAYHKKAFVLAKTKMAYTHYSKIINIIYNENIWQTEAFLQALEKFSQEHNDKKIILISSNETYASLILNNKLPKNYIYNYPSQEILNSFINKELFYKKYAHSVISFPKTVYYHCSKKGKIKENDIKFPVILKPADVIKYNHLSFAEKNKIYKIKDFKELKKTIENIILAGYDDVLIIQEFIPGDDSYLFDSAVYCDRRGKVKHITFAQIGLQEHKKTMIGNAALLINGYNSFGIDVKPMINKIITFLEKVGYTGFAEVDMKYDYRDKTFKVLEINARQGRCSYYLAALGGNLVKILVDDLLLNKKEEIKIYEQKLLLSFVPKKIVKDYIVNDIYKEEVLNLWKKKKPINPINNPKDKKWQRKFLLLMAKYNYFQDYKNSNWENGE